MRRHRRPTLFPYTTLFRSYVGSQLYVHVHDGQSGARRDFNQRSLLEPQERLGGRQQLQRWRRDAVVQVRLGGQGDRKSTRLNSSHEWISYAVFCLKKITPKAYAWAIVTGAAFGLNRVQTGDCAGLVILDATGIILFSPIVTLR